MKKIFSPLFFLLVLSSVLLAQQIPTTPVQHLETTYNIASAKGTPRATVNWVADLKSDTAPYLYQVAVTFHNNSDKVFGKWNLAFLFLGTVTECSSEVSDYTHSFSNGPGLGFIIFGPSLNQADASNPASQDIPPQGTFTFQYTYQLPAAQTTLQAPSKAILSRGVSYIATPAPVPSDAAAVPTP